MNLIIKGIIIGIGKIAPGISGAMLAISLGVYDKIIKSIANIKTIKKQEMIYLSKIGIGIIISIIITSKIIVKCLNKFYLATMLLLIGLIIGGLLNTTKQIKYKKKDIIISLLIISIFIIITLINKKQTNQILTIEYTLIQYIKLIGIGIIDALSSIIPGISGTALLMKLGYYTTILQTFATILSINQLKKNIFIMSAFIVGFIIGTIAISKIINKIMNKEKNILNIIISLFMINTIVEIVKKSIKIKHTNTEFLIGLLLLLIGTLISKKLEKI